MSIVIHSGQWSIVREATIESSHLPSSKVRENQLTNGIYRVTHYLREHFEKEDIPQRKKAMKEILQTEDKRTAKRRYC
jgi:hypothetical protein